MQSGCICTIVFSVYDRRGYHEYFRSDMYEYRHVFEQFVPLRFPESAYPEASCSLYASPHNIGLSVDQSVPRISKQLP